ncbi:MAG: transporter substrate-binding domain-containing protein [Thermaerobacter sp.]|nr:transporter substrate-binding domain-containing protein [Thermaerobacter sp.]
MRIIRMYMALYVLLLLLLAFVGAPLVFPSLEYTLTPDERAYLAELGTLHAVGDENFPPFSYKREDSAAGFERDFVLELARALGVGIVHTQGPWAEMRAKLERGEADFITGMRVLPERAALYNFTVPYHETFHALVVPRDSHLGGYSDLVGLRVAAQTSSATYEALQAHGIIAVGVPSPEAGLQLLAQGGVAAWVEQYWVARFFVGFRGMYRWTVHPLEETTADYAMAVSRHRDQKLVSILNKGLLKLHASGVLNDLHANWFGPTLEVGRESPLVPILMGAVGLATLGLGLLVLGIYLERQVARKTAELTEANKLLSHEQQKLAKMLLNAARALGVTIEIKDFNTGNHSQRVARVAYVLGKKMGLREKELFTLYLGALMHDIGKVGVSDAILAKAEVLSAEEYRQMRFHPEIGDSILRNVEGYDEVREIVLYHHERWDGESHLRYPAYPGWRCGSAIPLGARIVAVADTFDAITSDRPYRAAQTVSEALAIIKACRGTQFDPAVVDAAVLSADDLRQALVNPDDSDYYKNMEKNIGL